MGGSSSNCPNFFTKTCPFLFMPHACLAFLKYALPFKNMSSLHLKETSQWLLLTLLSTDSVKTVPLDDNLRNKQTLMMFYRLNFHLQSRTILTILCFNQLHYNYSLSELNSSERNSVVVGSNPTQANFLQLLLKILQWWIPNIYMHIYMWLEGCSSWLQISS